MKPGPRPRPLEDRFLLKVRKTDDCWFWIGARASFDGYGSIRFQGKNMSAHRASYMLYKGPIPPGMYVCHTCDTPPCVRPEHLFLGTHTDNMRDKMAKGRHRVGFLPAEVWSEIRREQWAKILPERRKEIIEQRVKLLPEQWAEIQKQTWAERSEEDRRRIAEKVAIALKDKPFTESHLANLRASPANQKGRPVRFVPPRKLTDEQWTEIAEEYHLGSPSTVLAEKYGVADSLILKVMRKFDVSRLAGYGTKKRSLSHEHGNAEKIHTDEQKAAHTAKMQELWASGVFANRKRRPKKEKIRKGPLTHEQWSEIRKKQWANVTPEQRAERVKAATLAKLGKKLSPEHREKLRAAKLGNTNRRKQPTP